MLICSLKLRKLKGWFYANDDENRLEHSFMRAQRRDVGVYASSEGSLLKVAFMRAKRVC